jgi:hypothetical protein
MKTQWICAAVLSLLVGCATEKPPGVTSGTTRAPATPVLLEPGPIGVREAVTRADFNFDKATGQIESARDAAGGAAAAMLNDSQASNPALRTGESALRFALAPVAAVIGAVRAAHEKLEPGKLAQCEADLTQAMALMAEQKRFRDCLLEVAGEKSRTRLVPAEALEPQPSSAVQTTAILETKVEELRLERTAAKGDSFALRIKSRLRLLRAIDGTVLYDQPFEYRSGPSLFLDWTLKDVFQGVTETGYRALAEQMIAQLPSTSSEEPVLVGAGYRPHSARASQGEMVLASPSPIPRASLPMSPARSSGPAIHFAAYVEAEESGPLGIYSTETPPHLVFQRPLTKDEAVSEALQDVEWSLDGLDNSPNAVVQLAALAAAVPMSLWKQTVAGARGLADRKYRAADAKLVAASRQTQPDQELACQVAELLAPKTSQPVVLVGRTSPTGPDRVFVSMQASVPVTVAFLNRDQPASAFLVSQGVATAVEIQVMSAALTGNGGINPPLSLCVEAKATLVRTRDGQPLYSCPVLYRGAARRFAEWATDDARPFRLELQQCYRQMSEAIVDQFVSRGLVSPQKKPQPTLAQARMSHE